MRIHNADLQYKGFRAKSPVNGTAPAGPLQTRLFHCEEPLQVRPHLGLLRVVRHRLAYLLLLVLRNV